MVVATFSTILTLLTVVIHLVAANTEKAIFKAPDAITVPNVHPGIEDLRLDTISPGHCTLSTQLPVKFPTDKDLRGLESWYLLDQLDQGRRYEVRICWAATQPTQFWLDVHTLTEAFETPELIQGIAQYSELRQESRVEGADFQGEIYADNPTKSLLLLRVFAAADYYTTNKTLMESPLGVDVDIILDPYLLNAFPRSLVPTAIYLVILAVGSWYLSGAVWRWLQSIEEPKPHSD